jgi:hypothetical protein
MPWFGPGDGLDRETVPRRPDCRSICSDTMPPLKSQFGLPGLNSSGACPWLHSIQGDIFCLLPLAGIEPRSRGPGKVYSGFCRRTNKHKSNRNGSFLGRHFFCLSPTMKFEPLSTGPPCRIQGGGGGRGFGEEEDLGRRRRRRERRRAAGSGAVQDVSIVACRYQTPVPVVQLKGLDASALGVGGSSAKRCERGMCLLYVSCMCLMYMSLACISSICLLYVSPLYVSCMCLVSAVCVSVPACMYTGEVQKR